MASNSNAANVGLYEPLEPSPYKISATNHSAYVLLPELILFTITALVVLIKIYTAWTIFKRLRMDDYAVIAALGLYLARTITLCLSVRYGLGSATEHSTPTEVRRLSKLYLASDVLLYPLLACAKCATALLVILIQTLQWLWIFWALCGVVIAWALAALCVTPSQCSPSWAMGPTDTSGCIDQYMAQIGIKVVDILTDLALAVLPGLLFMGVQMSQSKRLVVATLFGLRIMYRAPDQRSVATADRALRTPVFTALSLAAQRDFYSSPTTDRPFKIAEVSIWTSMAAGTSLITACIPSIRRFIADWAAGVSNTVIGSGGIPLSTFNHSKSSQNRSITLRPSLPVNTTWIQGGKEEHRGRDDDEDSRKGLTGQITQTTDFTIHTEQLESDKDQHSRSQSRGSSEASLVDVDSSTARPSHRQRLRHLSQQRFG